MAALFLWAAPVVAFNTQFLEDAPIARFNDEDVDIMMRSLHDALDAAGDGEQVEWSNNKTGHHGSTTPLDTITKDGQHCRNAVIRTFADHLEGSARYLLCKEKDGNWQVRPR